MADIDHQAELAKAVSAACGGGMNVEKGAVGVENTGCDRHALRSLAQFGCLNCGTSGHRTKDRLSRAGLHQGMRP